MTTEDVSHWPLVVARYQEIATLDTYQAQLASWVGWLAREEPFALLRVYATPESLVQPESSATLGKSWLAQNRSLLKRWMIGMSTVILPPQHYVRWKNLQVEKAFGVPGGVHASVDEAIVWLQQEVFAPHGIRLPVTAAEILR